MELLQILLLALVPTIAIELGVLLFVRERSHEYPDQHPLEFPDDLSGG